MKQLKFIVKAAISFFLLFVIFRKINLAEFIHLFHNINYVFLIFPFIIFILLSLLRTSRWKLILDSENIRISFGKALIYSYIGEFSNLFLPTRFGGDIVRIAKITQNREEKIKLGLSVIFERLIMIIALIVFLLFSTLAGWKSIVYEIKLISIGMIIILAGIICLIFSSHRFSGYFTKHLSAFEDFVKAFASYSKHRMVLFKAFLMSLVDMLMIVSIYFIIANILLLDIPFYYLLITIPIVIFFTSIPISLNGVGVRESILVMMLSNINILHEQALMLALTFYAVRVIHSLIGSIFIFA